ncbi:sulfurtransferase TusA family protein [Cobetia marina]|jgi:TusA-related sulfurtransferase|uniref:sulfurtransferase TusA family protein n=1 Tax=Cobetia TaxID=204286 RepID=UPI000984A15E|nr:MULTISPECIES: sulfurtransferase TusA family protein [Cobetia]AZV30468.1 sulfurtransferase TusA family protein [Cobetia sp. ICG0124]MDA5565105.1 sulfurtransferase TusA family protein [Cobetia sp. MMG027]MDH2292820.1 sulfurtransferase TusA family protein [Cobetia sp. 10Alg 146]MDH2375331.1 sulfurtransferase TusA family protein [Cobetia sp. 3AK]MDI6004881.1 sulfurtransferase TusA family protein [Cobetia pacifica]
MAFERPGAETANPTADSTADTHLTTLDARGLHCPLPLLRTKLALAGMSAGEQLEVLASDAGAWGDIPAYLALSDHALVSREETAAGDYRFVIKALTEDDPS